MPDHANPVDDLFLSNEQIIKACPFGRDVYWKRVKPHPAFPAPVLGGPGKKQLYSAPKVREFFERVAAGEVQL